MKPIVKLKLIDYKKKNTFYSNSAQNTTSITLKINNYQAKTVYL